MDAQNIQGKCLGNPLLVNLMNEIWIISSSLFDNSCDNVYFIEYLPIIQNGDC